MGSYENSGGGRWESPDMSMLPRPVIIMAPGYRPPGGEFRPERRGSPWRTAAKILIGTTVLGGAAVGVDSQWGPGYVDRLLDRRSGVCIPTRARDDGRSYKVCFNRDSIYPRQDRTTGAKVESVRQVDGAPDTSGSTAPTVEPTETAAAQPSEGSPTYYDLAQAMCVQLGAAIFQEDVDYIKAVLIERQGKLGRTLPADPSQLIITSDYSGQPAGGKAAVVSC